MSQNASGGSCDFELTGVLFIFFLTQSTKKLLQLYNQPSDQMFRPFSRLASSIKRQAPGLRFGVTTTSSRGVAHRAPFFLPRPTLSTFPPLSSSSTSALQGREFKRGFSFVPSSFARSAEPINSALREDNDSSDDSVLATLDTDAAQQEQVVEQEVVEQVVEQEVVEQVVEQVAEQVESSSTPVLTKKEVKKAAKKAAWEARQRLEDELDAAQEAHVVGVEENPVLTEEEELALRASIKAWRDEWCMEIGGVHPSGKGKYVPPQPWRTFDDVGFTPRTKALLMSAGFTEPTPIQAQAWPVCLERRDIVSVSRTGSGKTLGFLLPIFEQIRPSVRSMQLAKAQRGKQPRGGDRGGGRGGRGGRGGGRGGGRNQRDNSPQYERAPPAALVLAPTRELAVQIEKEIRIFGAQQGIRSVAVYGGDSKFRQMDALRRAQPQVIVATPVSFIFSLLLFLFYLFLSQFYQFYLFYLFSFSVSVSSFLFCLFSFHFLLVVSLSLSLSLSLFPSLFPPNLLLFLGSTPRLCRNGRHQLVENQVSGS